MQEHPCTCGIAVLRTVLHNNFNVKEKEDNLINLIEEIQEEKLKEDGLDKNELKLINKHKIKEKGTDIPHIKLLAEAYGLNVFSKSHASVENIKYLLDNSIWPIIHRPSEIGEVGHYVLPYFYNHTMYLFDPYPKEWGGGRKKENYNLFDEKWIDKQGNKWFIFLYNKDNIKIPFKGKYL
jgi:hypothetical protein